MNISRLRIATSVVLLFACGRVLDLPPLEHGTVRGRVVATGTPVAGARLSLDRTPFEATSRGDGTFVLRGIPRGTYSLVSAHDTDADGRNDRFASPVAIELASAGEDLDVRDLELAPAASIIGVVRGAGAAISGATVYFAGAERLVPADGAGRFRITGVPPGSVELWASAPGYVPASARLDVSPGESKKDVTLALARSETATGTITGTIRLANGTDPGDIRAQLLDGSVSRAVTAVTADGSFVLGPMAPGTYELRIDATGYETTWLRPVPIAAESRDVGELWLRRGAADPQGTPPLTPDAPTVPPYGDVSGRVVVDGEPRRGVTIRLAGSTFATSSRLDGTFLLDHVPLGRWSLDATQDADDNGVFERARRVDVEVSIEAPHVALGDLELATSATVAGRVVGSDTAPRPGALVVVTGTRLAARTGDDGRFEIVGVPRGPQTLSASTTGYIPAVREIPVPFDGDVELTLAALPSEPARHSITGAIRFLESPDRIPFATIQLFRDGTIAGDASTDEDGFFRISSLAPGLYSLRVDAPGRRTLRVESIPVADDDVDLGLLLVEPGAAEPAGSGPALPGEPPPRTGSPRSLVATGGDARVTLTWEAPETGADSYIVHRADSATAAPLALNAAAPATATSFIDSTVVNYRAYHYRVTARRSGVETPLADAPMVQVTPGAGTVLGGPLRTRRLGPAGNPHIILGSDLVVLNGETLTIDPGAELRFADGLSLIVEGTLVARGTEARPVVFTRHASSWNGLTFSLSATDAVLDAGGTWQAGSVLSHVIVEHSTDTGVTILESSPLLEDSEIRDNGEYTSVTDSHGGGLRIGPGAAPLIRRCHIHHNWAGVVENDTNSSQWGAGIYSEGEPVIHDNEITFNELRATSAGNSTSYGPAIFLRSGRATVSANHIASNSISGSGQANTGQVLRVYGMAMYIDSGSHLVANNTFESHSKVASPAELAGTLYVRSGTHVLLHDAFLDNNLDGSELRGGGVAIDRAAVTAWFNVVARNRLVNPVPVEGSGLYTGNALVTWGLGNFIGGSPNKYEIYNAGSTAIDLSRNHFASLPALPVTDVIYRPATANAVDLRDAPIPGAGPKRCLAEADCSSLGGAQRCHFGGCVPTCFVATCAPGLECDPESGACAAE